MCIICLVMTCDVFRPDGEMLLLDSRRDDSKPFLGLAFKLEASTSLGCSNYNVV